MESYQRSEGRLEGEEHDSLRIEDPGGPLLEMKTSQRQGSSMRQAEAS
jgi:hypothetical protein